MSGDSKGFNESERYLSQLCKRSFLSLWSHTNVFRQSGHELCDVFVKVGNDIIIFSDKKCEFPNTGNLSLDWKRWFKRAVLKSANQLWGAENWIRRHPERMFLDDKCTVNFPLPVIVNEKTQFYLVLVAHGASKACMKLHGGSGSLMFHNTIVGINNHDFPFAIGDLDISKSFIHVLDDYTLDILLENRDTITDFIQYLKCRKEFLRSKTIIISSGEEELLTFYMKSSIIDKAEGFLVPLDSDEKPFESILLQEGCWDEFQEEPERKAQLRENEISYMWDMIIERLSTHAKDKTYDYVSEGGFVDCEMAIRMMALQTRFERRVLSLTLKDILLNTDNKHSRLRVIPMPRNGLYFVLVVYPRDGFNSYEQYRIERRIYIQSVCMVVMNDFEDAKHVVGIATETGIATTSRTEDLMYIDRADWTEECIQIAKEAKSEFDILTHANQIPYKMREYPEN